MRINKNNFKLLEDSNNKVDYLYNKNNWKIYKLENGYDAKVFFNKVRNKFAGNLNWPMSLWGIPINSLDQVFNDLKRKYGIKDLYAIIDPDKNYIVYVDYKNPNFVDKYIQKLWYNKQISSEVNSLTLPNLPKDIVEQNILPNLSYVDYSDADWENYIFNEKIIPDSVKKVIKKIVIPKDIVKISKEAFSGCALLNEVIFEQPSSLKIIEEKSFFYCWELKEINLPNSLEEIHKNAFSNSGLENNLIIPDSVKVLEEEAFLNTKIKDFKLSSQINVIPQRCFENTDIETLIIPDTVTDIKAQAFRNLDSLKDIKFSNNMTVWPWGCFEDSTNITKIIIPEGIERIEKRCFYNCAALESIILPKSLQYIGEYAFAFCRKLKTIEIPENVKIEKGAFSYCEDTHIIVHKKKPNPFTLPDWVDIDKDPNLIDWIEPTINPISKNLNNNILLENDILYLLKPDSTALVYTNNTFKGSDLKINSEVKDSLNKSYKVVAVNRRAFINNNSIVSIDFPDTLQVLGSEAFMNCNSLKSISLPDSLLILWDRVFNNCENLSEVTISKNLKKVGSEIFTGCKNLNSINFKGTKAEFNNNPNLKNILQNSNIKTIKCTDALLNI